MEFRKKLAIAIYLVETKNDKKQFHKLSTEGKRYYLSLAEVFSDYLNKSQSKKITDKELVAMHYSIDFKMNGLWKLNQNGLRRQVTAQDMQRYEKYIELAKKLLNRYNVSSPIAFDKIYNEKYTNKNLDNDAQEELIK